MKRIRAQFILLASLLIAIIIFSTYIIYYSMSRSYEQTRRSEINYQLLNTSNDFDRATLNALASASQTYGITGDMYKSRKNAILLLSQWQQLAKTVYNTQTIKIGRWDTWSKNDPILGNIVIPEAPTYNDALNSRSWIKLYWYKSRALSIINVTLAINMTNPVLVGYKYNSVHFLNITSTAPILSGTSWQFNITVINENGPDTTLSKTNIKRLNYIDKNTGQWINATNYSITSVGNGVYTVSLNDPNVYYYLSQKIYIVPILLGISDNRGIYAELIPPPYSNINIIVQDVAMRNSLNSNYNNHYRVYTVSISGSGTMEFNLVKFSNPNNVLLPAVPPLPIKQIRVNVTKLGPNDIPKETPFQVEQWNNINTRYEWPLQILSSSTSSARFSNNMKLVFLLYFNYTTATQQKIVIWWKPDADTPPGNYGLNFRWDPSGYAEVDNGLIKFSLVVNQALSNWVDFSVQLSFKNYHAEYWLFGYSYHPFYGGLWYPKWLPSGDPEDRMGWNALVGPVRIILFRISNKTYAPPTGETSYTQYQHYDLIIIPYGTTYVIYRTWDKWLSSFNIYRYITPIGIVSGSSKDYLSPNRLKYWAYQSISNKKVYINNGQFSYSSYLTHVFSAEVPQLNYDERLYGNWMVEYQEDYSFGLIFSMANIWGELPSYYNNSTYYKVVWVWTSADYARRVMELDIVNDRGNRWSYSLYKSTDYQWYWAAFFAGDGGSLDNGYKCIMDHSTMFNVPLQIDSAWVG